MLMMKKLADKDARPEIDDGDLEPVSGQPIDEAEKNLSSHATSDSSPPVGEEERTSVKTGEMAEDQ